MKKTCLCYISEICGEYSSHKTIVYQLKSCNLITTISDYSCNNMLKPVFIWKFNDNDMAIN